MATVTHEAHRHVRCQSDAVLSSTVMLQMQLEGYNVAPWTLQLKWGVSSMNADVPHRMLPPHTPGGVPAAQDHPMPRLLVHSPSSLRSAAAGAAGGRPLGPAVLASLPSSGLARQAGAALRLGVLLLTYRQGRVRAARQVLPLLLLWLLQLRVPRACWPACIAARWGCGTGCA
jgi:hypothetical protein